MKWLNGQFLVASPHLADPNFYRSVVLLVQHHEQGALGLILNRPTDIPLKQICDLSCDQAGLGDQTVGRGGPVEGPLTALHARPDLGEEEVCQGVFFAAQADAIRELIERNEAPCGFFVGYAGWGAGQLEGEMEAGGWLTAPAKAEVVFSNPDDLWDRVVREIGRKILTPSLHTKHLPPDPNVN